MQSTGHDTTSFERLTAMLADLQHFISVRRAELRKIEAEKLAESSEDSIARFVYQHRYDCLQSMHSHSIPPNQFKVLLESRSPFFWMPCH